MTFPDLEDHRMNRESIARRDAEPRIPQPTTAQEAVDRLVSLIADTYRSGARFVRVKVAFDPAVLTDLPFPVPDSSEWGMISPHFRRARYQLDEHFSKLIDKAEVDFCSLEGFIGLDKWDRHSRSWSISAEVRVKAPN